MISNELLRALPKTDIHCHLDGSLRLDTLIELAKERSVNLPSYTPEGLKELVFKDSYRDLPDYLHGFAYTCGVMSDAVALERIAYELGQDCLAEGVTYLEVRFAPQLHVRPGLDVAGVLAAVDRGLDRARREDETSTEVAMGRPPFRYGIIASAMRMFTPGFAPYYADFMRVLPRWPTRDVYGLASLSLARAVVDARDRLGIPVVGFDLAGAEAGFPADDHTAAYDFAQQHFLKKTVHAGEAYGPESIFQAITSLHADRIGHGTRIFEAAEVTADPDPARYVHQLSEYVADRRITLEVCITSNMQTMPNLRSVSDHPLGKMLQHRLSVTLCTDNRLVSNTTVTEELAKARDAFNISQVDLRNMVLHGYKRSFFPGTYREKRAYVRKAIDWYDRVSGQHGLPPVVRGQ